MEWRQVTPQEETDGSRVNLKPLFYYFYAVWFWLLAAGTAI